MANGQPANFRTRNYVFTFNNYGGLDLDRIQRLSGVANFIGYGKEIGASGTRHLQGMVCWKSAKTFRATTNLVQGAHIEIMGGTPSQAWAYCSKDGDTWSVGQVPLDRQQQSEQQSCKWAAFIERAKNGDMNNVDQKLLVQYYSTFMKIMAANQPMPENLQGCCGIWIHGAPGTGKSHAVNAMHPDAYRKMVNRWWDGYQNQATVWLDDLDPDSSTWIARYLKIWADKWSFMAEVKGASSLIRPSLFIVTSNYTIDQMGFRQEDLTAIKRRFREVEKIASQDIIL